MSQIDKVKIFDRRLIVDDRGWFLKAITGKEDNLPQYTGEVYLTMGKGGQAKGCHYHLKAVEWFTLVFGNAILKLEDVETHVQKSIRLSVDSPATVFIPNGVAHKIYNKNGEDFILLAYTNMLYDPRDSISYNL